MSTKTLERGKKMTTTVKVRYTTPPMPKGIWNVPGHRARIIDNLTDIGNSLTTFEVIAGMGWYKGAENLSRRLAREYGCTKHQAAGVIAAMSPNTTWAFNIQLAELALSGNPRGLGGSVARAKRILAGGSILSTFPDPSGSSHKIREFYRAISGNTKAVVIDRWALRAAWGRPDVDIHNLERVGVYEMVSECYVEVARLFDMTPRDFQASVWVHVRGSHE